MCYLYSCTFVNDLEVPIIDHEAHFGIEVEIDSSLLRRGSERGIELSDYNPSCDGWMGDEGRGDALFSERKRLNLGCGIAEVMPHVAFRRQILALIDLLDFLACETVAGQRIAVGFSQHCSFTLPIKEQGQLLSLWISFSPSMFSAMTNRSRRAFWSVGF